MTTAQVVSEAERACLLALYDRDPFGRGMTDASVLSPAAWGSDHDTLAAGNIGDVLIPLSERGLVFVEGQLADGLVYGVKLTAAGRGLVEQWRCPEDWAVRPSALGNVNVSGNGHTVALQQGSPGATLTQSVIVLDPTAERVAAWAQEVLNAAPGLALDDAARGDLVAVAEELRGDVACDAGRWPRVVRGIQLMLGQVAVESASSVVAAGLVAGGHELLQLVAGS